MLKESCGQAIVNARSEKKWNGGNPPPPNSRLLFFLRAADDWQGNVRAAVVRPPRGRQPMSIQDRIADEAAGAARDDLLGADEWKRSKIGYLTGFSAFAKGISGVGGIWKESTGTVLAMARGLVSSEPGKPLETGSADPVVRFQAAVAVYDRTEPDIEADVAATRKWFYLYFVLAVLALGFGIATWHLPPGPFGAVREFIGRFALIPALAALTMRAAFYNWQLRTRALGSFGKWIASPGAWFPPDRPRGKGGMLGSIAPLAAIGLMAAFSVAAHAQGTTAAPAATGMTQIFATPDATKDVWMMLLSYIFPGVGPLGTSMSTSMSQSETAGLFAASGTFLSVLMMLGSLMVAWHTLSGTVAAAHDGKALGQKWHALWAPVRVSMGFGMLVPVTNGFCLAQILVIQVAVWGGSFGNVLWASYVNSVTASATSTPALDSGINANQTSTPPEAMAQARDIMLLEVCRATGFLEAARTGSPVTTTATQSGEWLALGLPGSGATHTIDETAAFETPEATETSSGAAASGWRTVLNWVAARGGVDTYPFLNVGRQYSYGSCGSIWVNYVALNSASDTTDQVQSARTTFDTTRIGAVQTLIAALRPIGISLAKMKDIGSTSGTTTPNTPQPPAFSTVVTAVQAYGATMTQAATTLSTALTGQSMSTVASDMTSGGWATAGMYYMAISRLHDIYNTALTQHIAFEYGAGYDKAKSTLKGMQKSLGDSTFGTLPLLMAWWQNGIQAQVATIGTDALNAGEMQGDRDGGDDAINRVIPGMALRNAIWAFNINLSQGSALSHMIALGHTFLKLFWGALATYAAMSTALTAGLTGAATGAAAGAGGGPIGWIAGIVTGAVGGAVVSQVIGALSSIMQLLLIILFVVGALHAYVLPMMPYLQMFFFILGMLILAAEGVIAAPVWALLHIRMDGSEFIENVQRPGYMIMFNLLLRIPLAMFGFFLSFLIFDIIIWFESQTLTQTFLSAVADTGYGISGILVIIVMMAYLHYQTAVRSFGLITALPDRVSRWFGQGEHLGREDDEHASKNIALLAGRFESNVGNVMKSGAGGGMNRKGKPGRETPQGDPKPGGGGKPGEAAQPSSAGTEGPG